MSSLKRIQKTPDKIIFSSTISIYGENLSQSVYEEGSKYKPETPYAITKLEAEEYLLNNFKKRSWVLRFAPVYSETFKLNIQKRAIFYKFFYRIGNGKKKLSLCNIKNIRTSVEAIIEGEIPSGIYNISDTKEYNYNDLLKFLNAKKIIKIPKVFIKVLYNISVVLKINFIKEGSIKLISDNIFPSKKIQKYVKFKNVLN